MRSKLYSSPAEFDFDRKHPLHDGLMKLAAWLMERTACIDVFREGEMIPLSRNTMRSLLSGRYAVYIRMAESIGLLERDHRYREGHYPKSARLAERYSKGYWREVELNWARHADAGMQGSELPDIYQPTEVAETIQWLRGSIECFGVPDTYSPEDPWTGYAVFFYPQAGLVVLP